MNANAVSRRAFVCCMAGAASGAAAIGGPSTVKASDATEEPNLAAHAWLQAAPDLPNVTVEETYDVVVIGAGIAGCTAAQAAAEAGASVCVLEKFEGLTGHGTDIGAVGSKLQTEQGVDIDKALATRLIYQWGQSEANYYVIKNYVYRSGEVMDHYLDMAKESGYQVILNSEMTARSDWDTLEDRFKQFRTAHKWTLPEGSDIPEQMWNVMYFINMVADDARKNGAVFQFETPAVQLVAEEGRVVAVIAKTPEGIYKRVNATNGVILATGGITDNEEMKRCFCPISLRADKSDYTPVGGNMGDGLVMGAWVGAALDTCYPAPIIHPVNLSVMGPGFDTCWLTVNRDGMRYCCEVGYEPIVTNARMNTVGDVAWAIWDAHYPEHVQRQEPVKSQSFLDGLEGRVAAEVESGAFIQADTLEELAGKIGVPSEALQKTVDRYNGFCEAGEDPDFGVPERFLSSVKDAPFYACNVSSWLLAVPYGLRVDQNSQVLSTDDEPIGGLFAIGNAQGCFFANSYPVTLPGTSHGRGVTYGRLVGQALAGNTTIDGYAVGFEG